MKFLKNQKGVVSLPMVILLVIIGVFGLVFVKNSFQLPQPSSNPTSEPHDSTSLTATPQKSSVPTSTPKVSIPKTTPSSSPTPTPQVSPIPSPSTVPTSTPQPTSASLSTGLYCASPHDSITSPHLDLEIAEGFGTSSDHIWITLTDENAASTIYIGSVGGGNNRMTFHHQANNIRGSNSITLVGDSRNYMIKAYKGVYTAETPVLGESIFIKTVSKQCS